RPLHVGREPVARPLESWEVDQDELIPVAVDDAADPPPSRLRLVRDDGDLPAAERVHERRLPDVRPPGCGDESAPHAAIWNSTSVTTEPRSAPYVTSSVEWTPDSTRVCATRSAM